MAGNMHWRRAAVVKDDLRIAFAKVVDHPVDSFLIAGDYARREHHRVPRLDYGVAMVVHRRAGQRRERLALASRNYHSNVLAPGRFYVAWAQQRAVGNLQIPETMRNLGGVVDAAAHEGDFAFGLEGEIHEKL